MKENNDNNRSQKMEIDLHVAEYNALTSRCTYIMSIHSIVLAALVTWITVMVSVIGGKPEWFNWLFVFGIQIFAIVAAVFLYAYYSIIHYTETFLKPLIKNIIAIDNFWKYQSYVYRNRVKGFMFWQITGIILDAILIISVSIHNNPWSTFDIMALVCNLVLLLLFIHRTYAAIKIRSKIINFFLTS